MIPLTGLSSLVALNLVDATRNRQLEVLESQPQHARAINAFIEKIGNIETAEQFVDDPDVYTFVMKAYDLEDQIFGKAMIKKMLQSDIDDSSALVNRLTDPRLRALYKGLGFGDGGLGNTNTVQKSWQDEMVQRYVERQFINQQADQNRTVGTVLEVRQKIGSITKPLDILKDADVFAFFRRSLGLPDAMAQVDLDRQIEILNEKVDFEKIKDPAELEKMVRRYVVVSDALDGSATSTNAAVALMNSAVNASAGGRFVPITIDITAISLRPTAAYR